MGIDEIEEVVEDTSDTIYAMWHDPTSYNAYKHGPPYLPESGHVQNARVAGMKTKKQAGDLDLAQVGLTHEAMAGMFNSILADLGGSKMAELVALAAVLRAASFVHQSHHWRTRGPTFMADHELFSRAYDETFPFVDGLAERAIGSGGDAALLHPVLHSHHVVELVKHFCKDLPSPTTEVDHYVHCSLSTVLQVLCAIECATKALEEKDLLSGGISNMLEGISDNQETLVYLLRQRLFGV